MRATRVPLPAQPEVAILWTRLEAAERLRISWRTLHKLTKAGLIPHVRIGTRVLYREEDLRSYVASLLGGAA